MIEQFFKIGGVKNKKQFLAKYPTEASFFRQHPEAMDIVNNNIPFVPSYENVTTPQAMYGMGMAYGGAYMPRAQYGMQTGDPVGPPRQEDYPDYLDFSQALAQYLSSVQQQADTAQAMPQGQMGQGLTSNPAAVAATQASMEAKSVPSSNAYKGHSIVDLLNMVGMPSDFASRKDLASSFGITNYRGTASQNKQMIQLLQSNPDVMANYKGEAQPTGGTRKAAARGVNRNNAPTTQQLANAKANRYTDSISETANRIYDYQMALQNEAGSDKNWQRPLDSYYDYMAAHEVGRNLAKTGTLQSPSLSENAIKRNFRTGVWEPNIKPGESIMTVENAQKVKLAEQMNAKEAMQKSGRPMFKESGGEWNGTWNGNQGFAIGGSYIPDYASSAYGLPQFELGAPIYADGGMSPEEAMMMQQQAAGAPPPDQGGGQMDQQQIVQAIMQMLQQGMDPNQIMQQLVQGGVPQEMAQQLVMAVIQQVQGGAPQQGGGQEGMGGGQPNGAQPPMAPPSPEQGMEGMPMPGGMARGGIAPGWEGEVSMDQLEQLRKKGIKFEII